MQQSAFNNIRNTQDDGCTDTALFREQLERPILKQLPLQGQVLKTATVQPVAGNSQQNTHWSSRRCLVLLKALVGVDYTLQC